MAGRRGGLALASVLLCTFSAVGSQPALAAGSGDIQPASTSNVHRIDYNGDGYGDLAIGDPDGTPFSPNPQGVKRAGAVRVLYGGPGGLRSKGNQYWTQDSLGFGAEVADNFGAALASGDFNGDGFTDLAIGVPREAIGSISRAGAVNVIYGSRSGLVAKGAQFFSQRTPGMKGGAESWDQFGMTLAAGNFGKGRQDDLAIGIPWEDVGPATDPRNAGAVQVVYGSSHGLTTAGDQVWSRESAGISLPPGQEVRFGTALAAGDLGKSSYDDLAIGIPRMSAGPSAKAGGVYVIYGGSKGLRASGSQLWTQDSPGIETSPVTYNLFGSTLAIGNFGNGKQSDLAIGVPQAWVKGRRWAGGVTIIYGTDKGLSAGNSQFWSRDSAGIDGDAVDFGFFGWSLAAANFGHSGHADLAVGSKGDVSILYGTSGGLNATDSQRWAAQLPGDGTSLTGNDYARDGVPDLALGGSTSPGLTDAEGAVVRIANGTSSGLSIGTSQTWSEESAGIVQHGFVFGRSLGAPYCRGLLCSTAGGGQDFLYHVD